jgi:hypothetical protein
MRGRNGLNTTNTIVSILVMVGVLIALFWVARTVFQLLALAAPIFLIITLVMDHKVVLNYGKWLWQLLRNNTLMGIIATILTVFGFPVVCFFLFGRAILRRKIKRMEEAYRQEQFGEIAEYEIINEEEEAAELELPPLEKDVIPENGDEYERLFE